MDTETARINAICWSCCAGVCAHNEGTGFLEEGDHNMKTLLAARQDKPFMDRAEALSRIWDKAEEILEDRQARHARTIEDASRVVEANARSIADASRMVKVNATRLKRPS